MRKILVLVLAGALVLSFAAPSFALPRPVEKLARGVANVVSSPLEIGKQITLEWRATDKKQLGFLGGLVKGVGFTLKRLGSGLVDIVTFPFELKEVYEPIMKPNYVFEE
ncbi:MAG: exosortase system-associated protein, TIGR04073 family [Candidatus Omnitrophota bacterium]